MTQVQFCGFNGMITESSPHGNYLVVNLSDKITICGTFSNQWNWDELPEIQSGFISFITYIGCESCDNLDEIYDWIYDHNGYFKVTPTCDESEPRPSKRNTDYPFELKVRGLSPESVCELIKKFKGEN